MNGLPGRLTPMHIEKAEARGDNYINYKGVTYLLKDLKALVRGAERVSKLTQAQKAVDESVDKAKPAKSIRRVDES